MKLQGQLLPITFSAELRPIIHMEVREEDKEVACLGWDELRNYDVDADIKKHRNKRSRNANNYSWLLTDQLSDVMVIRGVKLSKDDMHAEMIFRYGQPLLDDDGDICTVSARPSVKVPEFYGYAKEFGESKVKGKLFKHYRIYRGSHTYDTHEMSIFISGIVEECKEHGIQTDTPDEIAKMLARMEDLQ